MIRQSLPVKEVIYQQAEPYFDAVLNAIKQAQIKIDVETYIFDCDLVGTQFTQALEQAALRGVMVRLLVDGAGIEAGFSKLARTLRSSGALVHIHRPLPWQFAHWPFALTSIKGIQKFWYLLSYINQRNHRKLVIIDEKIVWLGSINISQKHLSSDHGGNNWRDTAIELQQINTLPVQQAFNASWNRWRRKDKRQIARDIRPSPFLFNFTRILRVRNRKKLLRRMHRAHQRIWISSAYFVPDSRLLSALIAASHNGTDVRILLPRQSDIIFIPWASAYFYEQLLHAGVRIYEYQAGILHTKTLLIDDWATIGSSNFNRRSLLHDLEVDYIVQQAGSRLQLDQDFQADLMQSEEFTPSDLSTKKRWQRALGWMILVLFGYWV